MEQQTNNYAPAPTAAPAPLKTPDQIKQEKGQRAAVNSLAVIGFVALILIGITLAIYSARYIPQAVSQLASAGSALSSKNSTSTPASLSVISGGTSIPFSGTPATTTTITSANTVTTNAPVPTTSAEPITPVVSERPALYGLPDLQTSELVTGYLANGTNASFVPARVIPAGARAAVQFTVSNVGTNATGEWGFIAQLPETDGYVFTSPVEENMNPGGHILFTLAFDQVQIAPGPQVVTVQADPNNQVPESNETNNSASSAFEVAAY